MSQGNKKITRTIPATNNKILVYDGSFKQSTLVTNYKILDSTSTSRQDSLLYLVHFFGGPCSLSNLIILKNNQPAKWCCKNCIKWPYNFNVKLNDISYYITYT